jgi:multidrug efflux pump subunit AcrA (membrane-fusion protein)
LKKTLFWLAFLLLAGFFVAGSGLAEAFSSAAPEEVSAVATAGSSESVIRIQGRLVPGESVSLVPPAGARASEVFLQEGQRVSAGMVLLQLDSYPRGAAEVAASELEVVLAQQALDVLYRNAAVALAQAEVRVAEAGREQAFAADHFASLNKPHSQYEIDQAYANLLLAEKGLTRAQDDLAKAQKHFANKNHAIWFFMNVRQYKLLLTSLELQVADHTRRLEDALEKFEDLEDPIDPIDVDMAAAWLAEADANLAQAVRQREELANGPDPDSIEFAQARLKAAESDLAAAGAALRQAQLVAPISGLAVAVNVKPGEWMPAGQAAIVIADLNQWKVETDDIEEEGVPSLQSGQPVRLLIGAFPDLQIEGRIEQVDQFYREEDGDIYYGMTIQLPEADPRLRWGMTVEIEIETAGQ